jgi:hypothetical protein
LFLHIGKLSQSRCGARRERKIGTDIDIDIDRDEERKRETDRDRKRTNS